MYHPICQHFCECKVPFSELTCPIKSYGKIEVSFSVGGLWPPTRPFRCSLAASWDSKHRSLEEDFARKEQELRSEQVPKPLITGHRKVGGLRILQTFAPEKNTKGCSLCLGGLIWPLRACIQKLRLGTQNQMQCRHTNGLTSFWKFCSFLRTLVTSITV